MGVVGLVGLVVSVVGDGWLVGDQWVVVGGESEAGGAGRCDG